MASYRVMSWRGIPSQVKVTADDGSVVSRQMPASFQQEIDRVAMAEGLSGSDEYLEAWVWSDEMTRDGTAQEVAATVAQEVGDAWLQENDRA